MYCLGNNGGINALGRKEPNFPILQPPTGRLSDSVNNMWQINCEREKSSLFLPTFFVSKLSMYLSTDSLTLIKTSFAESVCDILNTILRYFISKEKCQ